MDQWTNEWTSERNFPATVAPAAPSAAAAAAAAAAAPLVMLVLLLPAELRTLRAFSALRYSISSICSCSAPLKMSSLEMRLRLCCEVEVLRLGELPAAASPRPPPPPPPPPAPPFTEPVASPGATDVIVSGSGATVADPLK